MSVERIAVVTAIISASVSAFGLLLTWYRGSAQQRPALARVLGGMTVASAVVLIGALAFAGGGQEPPEPVPGALTGGEYRLRLIDVCKDHASAAREIGKVEGNRHAYGPTVQLEKATVEKVKALRPPAALEDDHRQVVALWSRRVSLLAYYYPRVRREIKDPAFRREFARATRRIDRLSGELQKLLGAMRVTPECDPYTT